MSFDVSFFQIVASLALTFASLTVAGVSLYFTYRHNRGWKPAILIVERARMGPRPMYLVIIFEVWNRHKYPIVMDQVTVQFEKHEFIDLPKKEADDDSIDWCREEKAFDSYHSLSLDQNAHHRFHLAAPYEADGNDDISDYARIIVRYFDPIKNKYLMIKSTKTEL